MPTGRARRAVYAFILSLSLSCTSGGSGGEDNLLLVSSNVVPGQVRAANEPLRFTFNKEIEEASISLATIQIQPVPATVVGAPQGKPVQGFFHLEDEGKTVVFQPSCPTSENPEFGLQKGNEFSPVFYDIILPGGNADPQLKSVSGGRLGESIFLDFQIPETGGGVVDLKPNHPPRVTNAEELPKTINLNLFARPLESFQVVMDQPIAPESAGSDAIRITFEDPQFGIVPIPTLVELTENCTEEGEAVLTVLPLGILPPEEILTFELSEKVKGFGGDLDRNPEAITFHTARVIAKADPVQSDAILETFDASEMQDENPASLLPLASWKDGKVEAAPVFPGDNSDIIIEIGPDTPNGESVIFDTSGSILKDQNGAPVFFENGLVRVKQFIMRRPSGTNSKFEAIGPNPLIIQATELISIEAGGNIIVNGQDGSDVENVASANLPVEGGAGRAGGGDGGTGSPETKKSTAKGQDGNGPWNIFERGAEGGHSSYDSNLIKNLRAGGGGAGGWGDVVELNALGEYTTFVYSKTRFCEDQSTCPVVNCKGAIDSKKRPLVYNTRPEKGANGNRCTTQKPGNCDPAGDGWGVCNIDAVTRSCWAQGGVPSPAVFRDGIDENNFLGRKPVIENGKLRIIQGELQEIQGGAGGGGGGDAVKGFKFPNGGFKRNDLKGGGGAGGAGVLILQCQGNIVIDGKLQAIGGTGGRGEQQTQSVYVGGGGGAGAGGMIIVETPSRVIFGINSLVRAWGGNRSWGGGTLPGGNDGGADCKRDDTAAKGGAGGKGVFLLHLRFHPTKTISCGGITQPAIGDGTNDTTSALAIRKSGGADQIFCERDLTLAGSLPQSAWGRFDPAPHILIPTFGTQSVAQSDWIWVGWPTRDGSHRFTFEGNDPLTGEWLAGNEKELVSGTGSVLEINGPAITIENEDLANLAGAEARILVGDRLRTAGRSVEIQDAILDGNRVTLFLATPLDLDAPAIQDWSILRQYGKILSNGLPVDSFPLSSGAKISFQGADPLAFGSLDPDPSSLTPLSPDISNLQGKQLIRFRLEFDSNLQGDPLNIFLPLPGMDHLKILAGF